MTCFRVQAFEIGRALEQLGKSADMYPPGSEQHKRTAEVFATIKGQVASGVEAVAPSKRNMRQLEGGELHRSFASAVVALAREVSSGLYTATEFRDLIVDHLPLPDIAFWTTQSAGHMLGLLAHEGWERRVENGVRQVSDLRKAIESEGVLFWVRWEDEGIRLVNTRWLEAHADIRAWVLKPWGGGYTCRFCGMKENDQVSALAPVELERRNGETRLGDRVVLDVSRTHTHPECRGPWLDWVQVASMYSSDQAAAAADREAGRKSKIVTVHAPAQRLPAPKKVKHD